MRAVVALVSLVLSAAAALAAPGANAALGVGERRAVLVNAVDEAYAIPEGSIDVSRLGSRTVVVTGRRPGAAELRVVSGGREWAMPISVVAAPSAVAPESDDAVVTQATGPMTQPDPPDRTSTPAAQAEPPELPEAPGDDAPVTRSAPPAEDDQPKRITPVPPVAAIEPDSDPQAQVRAAERAAVRRAAHAAAELAERDFLPRASSVASTLTLSRSPERLPERAVPVASFRAPPRRALADDAVLAAPPIRATTRTLPRLTGVLRTAHGPIALLDGTPVGVGERHGDFTVQRVDDDRAVLEQDGATVTLKLPGR